MFFLSAVPIGTALFCLRLISPEFVRGTAATEHPVAVLLAAMLIAGVVWLALIPLIKKITASPSDKIYIPRLLGFTVICGLAFRAMFFGSTPIYEDDWNRYLWDGAAVVQGINPYLYSPQQVIQTPFYPTQEEFLKAQPSKKYASQAEADLAALSQFSANNNFFVVRINSPAVTTIYPPVAMSVFAAAARIDFLNLDVLRVFFWLTEALTLFLMIKALDLYGRSPLWSALYALNPLIIYSGMNAAHMDVILLPFLLLVLLWVKRRPVLAAMALSGAAAVKLWPLLLAPIIFRSYIRQPVKLIGLALLTAGLSAALLAPMLLAIDGSSGTGAYAATWQRNTYLFPLIDEAIGRMSGFWGTPARLFIAAFCAGLSLWLAFMPIFKNKSETQLYESLPLHLLLLTFVFFLLSPTGFPWYIIWLFAFFPFVPRYSVGLLTVLLAIYYGRYYLGETNNYGLFTDWLIPFQFGLPLLLFLLELTRGHWSYSHDR